MTPKKSKRAFRPQQWGMGVRRPGGADEAPPDPQAKELVCSIAGTKPRFRSGDGFAIWNAVWEVDGEDKPRQISIQGQLDLVNPGEQLACKGRWKRHPVHGWSFHVSEYRSALPQNATGIAAWLEARVDGVGPTFAKAIVDHFGAEQVFEILDADPTRLREVRTPAGRKLPEKQVDKAIAAWDEAREIRQIETFLFSHGVTPKLATRLYRAYGDEVVEILQKEPYKVTELHGIGFKIADRIALSIGIDPADPERLKSGVIYTLEEAEGQGHVYLSIEALLNAASEALAVQDKEAIAAAAGALAREGKVVVEDDTYVRQRVYLRRWHRCECRVASRIREMVGTPETPLFDDPERPKAPEGASPEEIEKLKLPTDEQWEIMELVRKNRLAILTGGPGCGKTQSVKLITDLAEHEHMRVALAAPTGKAARRLQEATGHPAQTIHRLLEYSPFEGGFKRDETNPLEADLVVIDESSMLSLDLADHLLRAIGPQTHLLLVGDPDQLPPVGVGKVFDDLIQSGAVPRVHLTRIFRQAARSMIIQNSRRINAGEMPYLRKEEAESSLGQRMINDFYWVPRQDADATFAMTIDMVCNRIPRAFAEKLRIDPVRDIMVLAPMREGKVGLKRINEELEKRLNPGPGGKPKKPIVPARGICVGSRIVQTKNSYHPTDPDKSVMNGEVAIVRDYDEEKKEALLSLEDGREIWVPTADMETYQLAWAMTVHRSQGSQFPVVVAPVSTSHYTMLSRALSYTAVTRASKLCVLVGEYKALAMAVKKVDMRKRNSSLQPRILNPAMSGELF